MGVLELITISILSFVSGFLVAFLLRIRVEIENVHSEPQQTLEEFEEVVLEKHEGEFFAYRKSNGEFLGKSPDQQELIQKILERIGNKNISIEIPLE